MLSTLDYGQIIEAIRFKDTQMLSKCPGIGKKSAQRIVIELTDKIDELQSNLALSGATLAPADEESGSVISALINLGYKRESIISAIEKSKLTMEENETFQFEKVFKSCLKILSN